jgi:hypothetical protein
VKTGGRKMDDTKTNIIIKKHLNKVSKKLATINNYYGKFPYEPMCAEETRFSFVRVGMESIILEKALSKAYREIRIKKFLKII